MRPGSPYRHFRSVDTTNHENGSHMFRRCPGSSGALPVKLSVARATRTPARGIRIHPGALGASTGVRPGARRAEAYGASHRGTCRTPGERPVDLAPGFDVQRCCRPLTGRQPTDGPRAVPLVVAGYAATTRRRTASAAWGSASALPATRRFRPDPAASTTADPARGSRATAGTRAARPSPGRYLCGVAGALRVQGPHHPAGGLGRSSNSGHPLGLPTMGSCRGAPGCDGRGASRRRGVPPCAGRRPVRQGAAWTGGGGELRPGAGTCGRGHSPGRGP